MQSLAAPHHCGQPDQRALSISIRNRRMVKRIIAKECRHNGWAWLSCELSSA